MATGTAKAKGGNEDAPRPTGGRPLTARRKLVAAAYVVMGRRGLEGCTIAEIVQEAGVGVGSFYNHFETKEDLARAVFSSRVEAFGAAVSHVVVDAPTGALGTCFAYRRLIEEAERDAVWAAFIVQLEPSLQMLDRLLRKYARVAFRLYVERGQLEIDDIETAITAIHAMEVAMVKAMLDGTLSHEAAHLSAALPLRMFGVPDAEAQRLSKLSMDELRQELEPSTPHRSGLGSA